MRSLILYLIFAGITPLTICGQPGHDEIQFHHLTDRDGLSQRTVRSIIQDSEGYMWFGTHDGLNKYNGYEITIYRNNPDDPGSISYNEISRIYEDRARTLWIATLGAGLNRYDRDKDRFIQYDFEHLSDSYDNLSDENTIYSLTESPAGNIWAGTDNGVVILDPEEGSSEKLQIDAEEFDHLNHASVLTLLTDSRDNIWIGTRNGLKRIKFGDNRFEQFTDNAANISDHSIQALYEDSRGNIWVGTQNSGLNLFDHETGSFTSYQYDRNDPYSISDNSVMHIHEDSHGDLWIGTENNGLDFFDRDEQLFFNHQWSEDNPNSLNNNAIYNIFESDNQILWIGTYNGGVNFTDLKENSIEHYRHYPFRAHSLSVNSVYTFIEDDDGDIWIGTDGGGLNRFDLESGEFTEFRHDPGDKNSIPGDVVLDLTKDHEGNIWIGTYRNGLSRFDPDSETFLHYRHEPDDPNSLNNNDIFNLTFDPANPALLWIGTNGGGVNVLDTRTDTFTHYVHDPQDQGSINQNDIRHIHRDSKGTLRIGNYGGFLVEFDDSDQTFYTHEVADRRFYTNVIQMIYEDSNGRMWFATWGGGLKRYDRNTGAITTYTQRDGLPNNNLHGILEDDHGNLWISSNNGISKFNPDTGEFSNYSIEDGLQGREFNPRAVLRDSEGYMYFGGVNGFNRFHPDSLYVSQHVAPVVFSDFRIFNEPVPVATEDSPLDKHISRTDELVLPYNKSVLTFEYVSLNYDLNKKVRYAYMLEGFEENWNIVGNRRSATYTNLNPGEYTFRVRVADDDGLRDEYEASLALVITPPFWQTGWFYGIAGLFTIGIIGFIYRIRVYNISQRNKELEQKVAEHTRDLNNTLTELQNTRDQLMEKAHKAGMADMATNVLHDVGNILNSVNTSSSTISSILNRATVFKLKKANEILRANVDRLEEFITSDPKGKTLLEYYLKLEKPLSEEYHQLELQNRRLTEKIALITDVVSAQQNYSKAMRIIEKCSVEQIIDTTLALRQDSFKRHEITVRKEYGKVDAIEVEKSKLIHVLINLLKNAGDSLKMKDEGERTIIIKTQQETGNIQITVADNGVGFDRHLRSRIFSHGFTTKASGHGFGLHGCANYVKEMGGSIYADSEGPGKGAVFTIQFPCNKQS